MNPEKKSGPAADSDRAEPNIVAGRPIAAEEIGLQNITGPLAERQQKLQNAFGAIAAVNPADLPLVQASLVVTLATVRRAPALSLKQASHVADRSPQTVAAWCRRYGIGRRVGGRWQVDQLRLDVLLVGGRP